MPAVLTITDPSGQDWVLDGTNGFWEGTEREGFHAPTYQHYRDESPATAGTFWRGVRALARELIVPIVIRDPNRDQLLAKRRALINAISPLKGECVITSSWPDGSSRRIKCRYVDGMERGKQGPGEYGVTVLKYGVRFIADDPFFYGDAINSVWSLAPSTRTELPVPGTDTYYEVVSASLLTGGVTIFNPGDVASYPTWTFKGPFTQIVAKNTTLNQTFTITYSATSTDTLTLVTDPGETSLADQNGVNRWDALSAGYQLWPLDTGTNSVAVTLTGSTVASMATLSFLPLYESD